MSGRAALICRGNEIEQPIGEQRLWVAVLSQAIEDWKGDRLRSKRAAEQFLFQDQEDFQIVCARAGIDPIGFRSRLFRLQRPENANPVNLAA